jgi:hypothetical protein
MNRVSIVNLEQSNANIIKELKTLAEDFNHVDPAQRNDIFDSAVDNINALFKNMKTVRGMNFVHRRLQFYKLTPAWLRMYLKFFRVEREEIDPQFLDIYDELKRPPTTYGFRSNNMYKPTLELNPQPTINTAGNNVNLNSISSNSSSGETPPGGSPSAAPLSGGKGVRRHGKRGHGKTAKRKTNRRVMKRSSTRRRV